MGSGDWPTQSSRDADSAQRGVFILRPASMGMGGSGKVRRLSIVSPATRAINPPRVLDRTDPPSGRNGTPRVDAPWGGTNPLSPLPAGPAPQRLPCALKAASLPMRRGVRSAFWKSWGHLADRPAARRTPRPPSNAAVANRLRAGARARPWPLIGHPKTAGLALRSGSFRGPPRREPTRGQQPRTRHSSGSRRKEGVRARPAANVAASQEGQRAGHRCGSRVPVAPMPTVGLPDRRAGLGRARDRPAPPPPSGRIRAAAAVALRA